MRTFTLQHDSVNKLTVLFNSISQIRTKLDGFVLVNAEMVDKVPPDNGAHHMSSGPNPNINLSNILRSF